MREILFRGKRIDNGEWVEGDLFHNDDERFPMTMIGHVICSRNKHNGEINFDGYALLEVDISSVGQYTGMKDKNGKKIFEGDICRNTRTDEIVSVKWHGTMAGYVWSKRKENSHLCDFGELFRAYDKYEVVGNIHDNTELLREG